MGGLRWIMFRSLSSIDSERSDICTPEEFYGVDLNKDFQHLRLLCSSPPLCSSGQRRVAMVTASANRRRWDGWVGNRIHGSYQIMDKTQITQRGAMLLADPETMTKAWKSSAETQREIDGELLVAERLSLSLWCGMFVSGTGSVASLFLISFLLAHRSGTFGGRGSDVNVYVCSQEADCTKHTGSLARHVTHVTGDKHRSRWMEQHTESLCKTAGLIITQLYQAPSWQTCHLNWGSVYTRPSSTENACVLAVRLDPTGDWQHKLLKMGLQRRILWSM